MDKMIFEAYAQKTHRLHPYLKTVLFKFFGSHPNYQSGRNNPSPYIEMLLQIYQGNIVFRTSKGDFVGKEGWNQFQAKFGKQENLTKKYIDLWNEKLQRLPKSKRVTFRWDLRKFLRSIDTSYLIITPFLCLPSGRACEERFKIKGIEFSGLSVTPCFMFLHFQVWAKGVLNFPGIHCGNCFDFSDPKGFALFLHEIYHIFQFRLEPIRMIINYLKGFRDSISKAKILFAHQFIPFELEAMAFHLEVEERLKTNKNKKGIWE